MVDYIDRAALKEKLLELAVHYTEQGRIEAAQDYNWAITLLMTAPAVNVAPVRHAQWEMRAVEGKTKAICTRCGVPNKQYGPPYCPHCGARMDGAGNA